MKCAECGQKHPEDRIVEDFGFSWEFLEEISNKNEWPLAQKLSLALIEMWNACEHQWHRVEFFKNNPRGV